MSARVHTQIVEAEVDIVNGPVAVRAIQWCSCELSLVFSVIDAAKIDAGCAMRACCLKVQSEALHL